MTTTQLFTQVNAAYRGSDDNAPTSGTDFTLWLATANRKQSEWARDTKQNWRSLWATDTLVATVAAGTQTYNLGTTFLNPSDKVVVTVGANTYKFTICEPQEAADLDNAAYISGSNPQKLTFSDPIIASSPIVGGTITVSGYHLLSDLVDGTSIILVDDPYWLVYAVASELAFNDITYSDKAPDLNAKANNLYSMMASNNRRGTRANPRTIPTATNRLINPNNEYGAGSN